MLCWFWLNQLETFYLPNILYPYPFDGDCLISGNVGLGADNIGCVTEVGESSDKEVGHREDWISFWIWASACRVVRFPNTSCPWTLKRTHTMTTLHSLKNYISLTQTKAHAYGTMFSFRIDHKSIQMYPDSRKKISKCIE